MFEKLEIELRRMSNVWKGKRPPDVIKLPYFLSLSQLDQIDIGDQFIVGKSQETLQIVNLSLMFDGPIFLITSMTSGLGKTSAIRLWLLQLSKQYSPDELSVIIIDYHTRTLGAFGKLPHIKKINENSNLSGHVTRKENLKPVLEWLKEEVAKRRDFFSKEYSSAPEEFNSEKVLRLLGCILIVIDDYESFLNSRPAEIQSLLAIIVDGEEVGVRVVIAEDYALLGADDLVRRAKKYGCGLLLGGSDGLVAFNDAHPPYNQKMSNLPIGRGYIIKRNQVEFIQTATYWEKEQEPIPTLRNLLNTMPMK